MDEQSSNSPVSAPQPVTTPPTKQNNEILMAILCYLGLLVIIPELMSRNDPFVKFHIKQGEVIVMIEVVTWFLASIFSSLWVIFQLINLGMVILSIIGIVNVVNKKQAEIPLVGSLAKNLYF